MRRITPGLLAGLIACTAGTDPTTEPAVPPPPGATFVWHPDADLDGFGDPEIVVEAPTVPAGHTSDASDCDDTDPDIHPDAYDRPNDGVDADCSGLDTTCTNAVVSEGDLVLLGDDAEQTADAFCASAAEITGTLYVQKTSLTTLDALSCLCQAEDVVVEDNAVLVDLSGLSEVALRDVTSTFVIRNNALLQSFHGPRLVDDATVEIRDNPALTSVSGFDGLRRAFTVTVSGSPDLQDLSAFGNLTTVLRLTLDDLPLADLSALSSLETVEELSISRLDGLSDLQGLGSVTEIGELLIIDSSATSLAGLDALEQLHTVNVEGSDLDSLVGLRGLDLIHTLKVSSSQLQSLDGLQDLRTADTLILAGNALLTDLTQAYGVTEIQSLLQVTDNESLPDGAAQALVDAIGADNIGAVEIQ
ncbi:MAG: hypothetical protein KTR31_02000 [Myxococcales bacterium]|nr:hypothetical protein [Myxococcales bacterium]